MTCSWIYRSMHKADSFIVNGADLDYTKNFMVNYAVLENICLKKQKF